MVWVALAGPASNFVQALLWGILLHRRWPPAGVQEDFFMRMAQGGVLVNLVMWAFNLFPLPPLDGGRVLAGLLPRGGAQTTARAHRTLRLLHRDGPGARGHRQQVLAEPADSDIGYTVIDTVLSPLVSLLS